MTARLPFLLLLAALLASPSAGSQDVEREQATAAQLEALQEEIEQIQQRVEAQTASRDELQDTLRQTELDIAANDRQLLTLQGQIDKVLGELSALDRQAVTLEKQRGAMETQLMDELRNLWALQQGGGLRVLLGDQGPDQTARNLAYYQALANARTESIAEYEVLITDIERNREEQKKAQLRLSGRRDSLAKQRDAAAKLRAQRQRTLAEIDRDLDHDNARIAKLEADSERLAALLEALRDRLATLDTPASYKPFADARGELSFPVSARPSNRFGGQRNAGNLSWRGWLMPADEGSDVRVIHHGRVVYSDWLRGQGLLMIVDHGDGWLSLYGHNRSLQAEVGDWVRPGDVIAKVGASGGASMPALYFEIRKDGQPVDPGRWLQR